MASEYQSLHKKRRPVELSLDLIATAEKKKECNEDHVL
jgi:hypothetical protein